MGLRLKYALARKCDSDAAKHRVTPLRAVGLAVEAGHKLAKNVGLGHLESHGVSKVAVAGDLEIKPADAWQQAQKCTLKLEPEGDKFAVQLVLVQRNLMSHLGMNIWQVDAAWPHTRQGSCDFVCDVSDAARDNGLRDLAWVELRGVEGLVRPQLREFRQEEQDILATAAGGAAAGTAQPYRPRARGCGADGRHVFQGRWGRGPPSSAPACASLASRGGSWERRRQWAQRIASHP